MDCWLSAVISVLAASVSVGSVILVRTMVDEAREIENRRLKLLVRREMRHHR